jgi:hypothetical protein
MAKKTWNLHLAHASLEYSDPRGQIRNDIQFVVNTIKPDVCSFTEAGQVKDIMTEVAHNNGYKVINFANTAPKMIYDPDRLRLKDQGKVKASDAIPGTIIAARYVCWARFDFHGEDVYYHVGHWIPGVYSTGGRGRVSRHNEMTQQMAAQVRKHASAKSISFFSGDTNADDTQPDRDGVVYNNTFRSQELLTVWDENHVYPGTHGGATIDVIGRYTPDKVVKNTRYKVYPRQNSDHRFISAWYDITQTQLSVAGGDDAGKAPVVAPPPEAVG